MRILLSSCGHWWNAEAAYAAASAEVLLGAGHTVWVLAPPETRNGAALRERGLPLLEAPALWAPGPAAKLAAVRALHTFQRRERVELVDVFRSEDLVPHLLATLDGSAAVVRTRGSARPVRGGWFNRRLYGRWGQGLILSSEALRAHMSSALGPLHPNMDVIHYPAPPWPAPDATAVAEARRALLDEVALPQEALLVAIVGRAMPEKGHAVLLEALATLRETEPRAALLVLDKGHEGEAATRAALHQQAERLGLGPHVRWLGYRDDVRTIMAMADVGAIPSLSSEMNCRVTVEFFAAGTPVAAFPTGALPEVVTHGRTGLVTAAHTAPALADALLRLLQDVPLRTRTGQAAREDAEGRFSRERFLANTLAVYERALHYRRAG